METTGRQAIIEVRNFSFRLGKKQILRDVSFTVAEGEYLSIVGPNGAGKTTLLKCIDRLLTGGSGRIEICGRPLESYAQKKLARLIGYVPQGDGQGFAFTVEQLVLMGRYPYLSPFSPVSKEDRQAVRQSLELTGTAEFAERLLQTLSGGERQKVFIAAALAQGARILLLDEPTTFLDYRHQDEVQGLLARVNRQSGTTIVSVTHDVNRAALESDRIVALREGSVVFCGPPPEIMRAEVLEQIYGASLLLVDHPREGLPMIVPRGKGDGGRGKGDVARGRGPAATTEGRVHPSSIINRQFTPSPPHPLTPSPPHLVAPDPSRLSPLWTLAVLAVLAALVLAAAPFVGMQRIPLGALWSGGDDTAASILWRLRIPRVCLAFLAGASLGLSGMAFQAVFRNPLATPFTLGVASGASLGAAVYIRLGLAFSLWKISGESMFAFAGAALSILAVYGLTRARRGSSTATMLLAGVAMGLFFSSLILFIQYVSDFTQTFRILRWVMGGLEKGVGFDEVLGVLPFAVTGSLIVFCMTHELNLITTGEELAASRGVEVRRTRMILFFAASLMVGAVVAVCGPIGFVGLMAPHICRLLIGPDHRYLMPATLLFGGAFLILCDTLARTVMAPTELPVGIITSLLGGPFFLWLLLGRRDDAGMG